MNGISDISVLFLAMMREGIPLLAADQMLSAIFQRQVNLVFR